jgi:Domain of unknown function (DUF4390)
MFETIMKYRTTHTLTIAIAWVWVAFFSGVTSPVLADQAPEVKLVLGLPHLEESNVLLDLRVTGLFADDVQEALRSGLPATVAFDWELWQQRASWWDRNVAAGTVYYRIFYDVLDEIYDVIDDKGRNLASCNSIAAVDSLICLDQVIRIARKNQLLKVNSYYVGVEARLEALDDEELRKLEHWLQGGDGGDAGDLIGSLTRQASEVVKSVTGFGRRSAREKTRTFSGWR